MQPNGFVLRNPMFSDFGSYIVSPNTNNDTRKLPS